MFKVGDRVICSGKVDDLNIDGQIGTIVYTSSSGISIRVKFDERFDYKLHGEDDRCWNMSKQNINHYQDKNLEDLMLD